jgi:signal transduction histidine kinase
VNLDKKVDEKTIEYNNLINKQKEFISMISHEIRSPISSAIFQSDSMIDDLKS